ncbi:MAG: ABC transporter permease [candidate division Zixibacteria bacterium]|nr:ABC transporter permease [candidate division Zixibacteria bacterium]
MINLLTILGKRTLWALENMGQFGDMVVKIIIMLPRVRDYWALMIGQMIKIGIHSLPIVLIIAFFAGMVTSVQTGYQFQGYVPLYLVGSIVLGSVLLELAPVLGGLVLSGRVGATIAAEIGTMKVTEQLDAMKVMAMDPVLYLAIPRILAGMFMLPVLVVFADLLGVLSGMVVAVNTMDVSIPEFERGMRQFFRTKDAYFGLAKAFAFGITITSVACYQGFKVRPGSGAEGVGAATTNTVVVSCILILVLDYLLAKTLL